MKGAILSFALMIMLLAIFIAFSWYIKYEDLRSTTSSALKHSISYTINHLIHEEEVTSYKAMEVFLSTINPMLHAGYTYDISLMGYYKEPLLLRFKIEIIDENGFIKNNIILEETMIEEHIYEE